MTAVLGRTFEYRDADRIKVVVGVSDSFLYRRDFRKDEFLSNPSPPPLPDTVGLFPLLSLDDDDKLLSPGTDGDRFNLEE